MQWEILYAIAAIVILAGLIYGVSQTRKRKSANVPITDAATRELYKDPDNYEANIKPKLQDRLEP